MGSNLALKLVFICSAIFMVSKVESRAFPTEEPKTEVGLFQPVFSDYEGNQEAEEDFDEEHEKEIAKLNLTDLFEGDMMGFTPEYTQLYSREGKVRRKYCS